MISSYVFAQPQFLNLLSAIPLLALWYVWQHRRQEIPIRTSTVAAFRDFKPNFKIILRHSQFVLRLVACALLIVAMARPQFVVSQKMIRSEGIDIVLALDISGSMFTRDFVPNRLEASKSVAKHFIDNRPNDRIGLVVFSSQAYSACPVTIDHESLKTILSGIQAGSLEVGTAIGVGIGTAVNRLQSSKSSSRVIILMTDGENNAGDVSPMEAAQLASSLGIRIYTIGMEPYS
ncbi:MAG: VWA domain-containing protein, partial [Chitinophagales bacterium]